MSHTPGPWEALFLNNGQVDIDGPDDELICQIPVFGDEPAAATMPNARLIAAAPDLLAACKAAFNFIDDVEIQKQVADAIEKAEGTE